MDEWYVIQVLSGKERKVKKNIEENRASKGMEDFILEILVPTENVSEVKKGERKITEKRIWPGYILIKMVFNDDSWSFIKSIDGVIDFLGGKEPAPLSKGEVDDILKDLEKRKEGVVHKHEVEVGDIVKIIDGVFINFTGNVLAVNHEKGRLSAMVLIFGRETRVDDLEFWQVEKVTSE